MIFRWLDNGVYWLIESVGLDLSNPIITALHFIIYDTIQITILLMLMIFIISYFRSYFPPERTKKILEKFKGILGNFFGSSLWVISPFCCCSSTLYL